MTRTSDPLSAAVLALLLLVSGSASPLAAQDVDFDLDVELLPLVQLPVAVARVEAAGVPLADLRMLVPTLFEAGVPPSEILETVRFLPAVEGRDIAFGIDDDEFRRSVQGESARGSRGMGSYVQALHDRGLRGQELAEAIHRELNRRGIPAGGADGRGQPARVPAERRGVLERGFLFEADDDARRGRSIAPGVGRGGPPADRGEADRRGPPADRGEADRRGPPADRGEADRRGPPEDGQGPPDDREGPPEGRQGPPEGRQGPPEGRGGPPTQDPRPGGTS